MRARLSGSCSASQASLLTVIAASGTTPVCRAHQSAPLSATSRVACGALRTSFQSSAGRTGSPSASRVTRPCCWPPTETAAQCSRVSPAASSSAAPHARGSTSVPSGWAAERLDRISPVAASTATTLQDWVEESMPTTTSDAMPSTVGRAHAGVARIAR